MLVVFREQYNVIDALLTGAGHTLRICGYLVANLIAFISVLHFADTVVSWLFTLIHHPEINFQYILGLLFYPFSVIIGIPLRDCLLSSKLIGIKVSLNEVSVWNFQTCSFVNVSRSLTFGSSSLIKNWGEFGNFVTILLRTTPFTCI